MKLARFDLSATGAGGFMPTGRTRGAPGIAVTVAAGDGLVSEQLVALDVQSAAFFIGHTPAFVEQQQEWFAFGRGSGCPVTE